MKASRTGEGTTPVEFGILGPTELWVNGEPVPLGAMKQRGLLALLLYHAGKPVQIDMIVNHLWDDPPIGGRMDSLYALASRVRASLRAADLQHVLVRVPGVGAYRLDVDPVTVDIHRFRRLVTKARSAAGRGEYPRAAGLLDEAIDLWRSEPLADLRGAASEHLRRNLQGELLDAQALSAESRLRVGEHDAVLARLEPFMQANPFDDRLASLWAAALSAAGRGHEAHAFITAFRHRYRRRMRAEPRTDFLQFPLSTTPTLYDATGNDSHARTVPAVPQQLPAGVPDFTGHDDLITTLDTLSSRDTTDTRVVVLTGMPGVGKTTLATHWARRRRDLFPDGQIYLNAEAHGPIRPVRPDDALGRFLGALGVPVDQIPADAEQRRQRYQQILARRRVLIILDNVLNSDQVRPLIPIATGCMVVITSRNRLKGLTIREGVPSLIVVPLPDPDRRTLLTQIIGMTRACRQPAALATLGFLSGGLPLALRVIGEHVAARPRASLDDLAEDLTTRLLDCEGDEDHDATLRTVFAWSYNALDPTEARIFRLLGLFPGTTIGVDAAAALLGADATLTERTLNRLARAHLINHDTARRYRLHDLLRRYASDRSQADEPRDGREAVRRRLLDWYLLSANNAATTLAPGHVPVPDLPSPTSITPLTFQTDEDAMRWCEAERANLLALVDSAAQHHLQRHAWQIAVTVLEVYDRYGRQDDMLAALHIAVRAAETDNHERGKIATRNNLGAAYFAVRDYVHAAANFEIALRQAIRIGDTEAQAISSHNLASVHLRSGKPAMAIEIYQKVLDICRESNILTGQASTLQHIGDAHRDLDLYEKARRCYQEALAIWKQLGSLRGQASAHVRLASLRLHEGQPRQALSHSQLALAIHRLVTNESSRCDALIIAADAHLALQEHAIAARQATEALTISDEIADLYRRARSLAVLADILTAADDHEAAYRCCQDALAILNNSDEPETRALLDRVLATREASNNSPLAS